MIENISINNYALIDKTEIELEEGLSIITGETGAGKSILLGAIGLTLGQRAESAAIMDKGKKCVVEIVYRIAGYRLNDWFEKNELDYSDSTVVRREVSADGKSRCFINDTPVNNKLLKEFGGFLIDIHSQHQSLLLGQPEYQTDILDAFCGNGETVNEYKNLYQAYRHMSGELKALKSRAAEAEKESDYLNFQFNQLDQARLQEGEKEELEEELALLSNAEAVKSAFTGLVFHLQDTDSSVIQVLKSSKNTIAGVSDVMKEAGEFCERLNSVIIELNDLADEAGRKAENLEHNPARIGQINARLNVIYDLMYKYKVDSVAELIAVREDIGGRLNSIQHGTAEIEELEKRRDEAEQQLKVLAKQIHDVRVSAEGKLCEEMKFLLTGLGIKHAEFVVKVTPTDEYTPTGTDEVKFLFSANKNQQAGEIAKVASGGEISRVMLSLKYVLSQSRLLPVIVFDEIDTGLSGEVAHKMAQMMKEMASRMQVISISHLPQIAAAGNCHFKVYKEDNPHATISRIKKLCPEERVREIAGMISGSEISRAALEAAKNLLNV